MEFGKLDDISRVDFRLPPDPASNRIALNGTHASACGLYLGATGYNMRAWNGKWYPARTQAQEMLRAYGRQFNTIEHNTTHYRIPDTETVHRWRKETPEDFRFCPKVPQTISHAGDLGLTQAALPQFIEAMYALGDRVGCCFLQLPPHFGMRSLPLLRRFLMQWPEDIPLAVEVRDPGFFDGSSEPESYFDLLRDSGAAAVITDVAGRRDVCHMQVTSIRTMVRFVGNGLAPSDYERIAFWADRLAMWQSAGLAEVYFFTHEPDNLLAPELAEYAFRFFSGKIPACVGRGPSPVADWAPQGKLFE